jgi:hypothetical protein
VLDRLPGGQQAQDVRPHARRRLKCSSASSSGNGLPTNDTSRSKYPSRR